MSFHSPNFSDTYIDLQKLQQYCATSYAVGGATRGYVRSTTVARLIQFFLIFIVAFMALSFKAQSCLHNFVCFMTINTLFCFKSAEIILM